MEDLDGASALPAAASAEEIKEPEQKGPEGAETTQVLSQSTGVVAPAPGDSDTGEPMAKDSGRKSGGYHRDSVMALHRTTMAAEEQVREAAIASLVEIVLKEEDSAQEQQHSVLLVVQTWLEQFARTNGGSHPAEYAAPERVRLVAGLRRVLGQARLAPPPRALPALRAAVGRLVNLAIEDMTRTVDVVEEVQQPWCQILVQLCTSAEQHFRSGGSFQEVVGGHFRQSGANSYVDLVCKALLAKLDGTECSSSSTSSGIAASASGGSSPSTGLPHFYVVMTLASVAEASPVGCMPYLKAVLVSLHANMRSVRNDRLRAAYAVAFSRFSDAILDHAASLQSDDPDPKGPSSSSPDPHRLAQVRTLFQREMDQIHEVLFSQWLQGSSSSSPAVTPKALSTTPAADKAATSPLISVSGSKCAVLEAMGRMAPLLSDERMYKQAPQVALALVGLYKKFFGSNSSSSSSGNGGLEPVVVTSCLSGWVTAVVDRDPLILDAVLEPLLAALFTQVCQFSSLTTTAASQQGSAAAAAAPQEALNLDGRRKNHYEALRCYDVLAKSHGEKLVNGLLSRMGSSGDDNVRLSSLTVLKHLLNTSWSLPCLQPRMAEVLTVLHSRLAGENSNRVRKMLVQVVALLGRLGLLQQHPDQGRDFVDFIVRLCALPDPRGPTRPSAITKLSEVRPSSFPASLTASSHGGGILGLGDLGWAGNGSSNSSGTFLFGGGPPWLDNRELRDMCNSVLQLLTTMEAMEGVLWPRLLVYLVQPELYRAVPSVTRSLALLAQRKRQTLLDYIVDYAALGSSPALPRSSGAETSSPPAGQQVWGPYVLFARLVVLAAVPFVEGRGSNILSFLQNFAPNFNKHLVSLWDQRIPLLQHYLETAMASSAAAAASAGGAGGVSAANCWDQAQWEEWLLGLVEDTVKEVDLDEWTSALAGSLGHHLVTFYSHDDGDDDNGKGLLLSEVLEKCFLMRCLGRVLKLTKSVSSCNDSSSSSGGHNSKGRQQALRSHQGGPLDIHGLLAAIFQATKLGDTLQESACAAAFGHCSIRHLKVVLDKLGGLQFEGQKRNRGSFFFGFSLLRDPRAANQDQATATRCLILKCVSEVCTHAKINEFMEKADSLFDKFIKLEVLVTNCPRIKVSAFKALSEVARTLQKACKVGGGGSAAEAAEAKSAREFGSKMLTQHGDFVAEAIDCVKNKEWLMGEKQVALEAVLELLRIPTFQMSQMTRCSLLKALFTSLFPALLGIYQEASSSVDSSYQKPRSPAVLAGGVRLSFASAAPAMPSALQTTPSKTTTETSRLEVVQVLDTMLLLIREVQLREGLKQSILDEIFTLLEPHLKSPGSLAREMATIVLCSVLRVFLTNLQDDDVPRQQENPPEGDPADCFSPGPYILGSLIPRCFDSSNYVQATALKAVLVLLKILAKYRSHHQEGDLEDGAGDWSALEELQLTASGNVATDTVAASAGSLPMDRSSTSITITSSLNQTALSRELSAALRHGGVDRRQLLPLLHIMVEGLLDEDQASSRGLSLVLCSMLEYCGEAEPEVKAQSPVLAEKLHSNLLALDDAETRVRTLAAARITASHDPEAVVAHLLRPLIHKASTDRRGTTRPQRLPFDEAMVSIWRVLAQDPAGGGLSGDITRFLIDMVAAGVRDSPERDDDEPAESKEATETAIRRLSANVALGIMFGMKEMEAVIGMTEFELAFVPMLLSVGLYFEAELKRLGLSKKSLVALRGGGPVVAVAQSKQSGLAQQQPEERRSSLFGNLRPWQPQREQQQPRKPSLPRISEKSAGPAADAEVPLGGPPVIEDVGRAAGVLVRPCAAACYTLQAFLDCRGLHSVALVVKDEASAAKINLDLNGLKEECRMENFAEFVRKVTKAMAADFPQYLGGIGDCLLKTMGTASSSSAAVKVASAAFFAQLLQMEATGEVQQHCLSSPMKQKMTRTALETLLPTCSDEAPLVRVLSLEGLSYSLAAIQASQAGSASYSRIDAERILSAFLIAIGGSFEDEVNVQGIKGLALVLSQRLLADSSDRLLPWDLVKDRMGDIVCKVYPFFDAGSRLKPSPMAAAAIMAFSELASFVLASSGSMDHPSLVEAFSEQVQHVLVSLLLLVKAGPEATSPIAEASRIALARVFRILSSSGHDCPSLEAARIGYLEAGSTPEEEGLRGSMSYLHFLRQVCRTSVRRLQETFPSHVDTAMGYFKVADPNLRCNAVNLVNHLVTEGCPRCFYAAAGSTSGTITWPWVEHGIDPGKLCGSLVRLMSTDPDNQVVAAAASCLGKVYVALDMEPARWAASTAEPSGNHRAGGPDHELGGIEAGDGEESQDQ